jgi:charged multivesicular body protein 4
METMEHLDSAIDRINKRITKLDVDMNTLTRTALEKKKLNDKRGALFALKRKKMLEKEVFKLGGQMTLLES